MLEFLERTLIFFPTRYPDGDWSPRDFPFEDTWFTAADQTRLHGWYVPHERPRAVVLFSHGNGGNLTHRAGVLWALRELVGVSVLIYDYRGYGRSEGTPDEPGILADARAARAYLAQRTGVAEADIVQMGESLGGAVAVDLAARDGARALILQGAFTSLPEVAAFHYPWLPAARVMRTRLDSLSKIGQYRGPLLMIHAEADTIIPYRLGRRLFDAANEPKKFVTLAGRDHNDPLPPECFQTIRAFLEG